MRKWFFLTATIILALCSFINYGLLTACASPFVGIENVAVVGCAPIFKVTFLLFTFATAAMFLAFIIIHDQEADRKKK